MFIKIDDFASEWTKEAQITERASIWQSIDHP